MSQPQHSLECLPELRVEDCVDDGVETGVDISKEGGDVEGNVARGGVEVVFDTESIKDVAGEEGCPANQKTCLNFIKKQC